MTLDDARQHLHELQAQPIPTEPAEQIVHMEALVAALVEFQRQYAAAHAI